ncbi:hypothetical protein V1478_017261 [Vespula squamosa]|uniref:Uncharacterized protein n=1 Tax=Vespula squamosa TaxID=30214 RepID=A0ABD1ZXH2_VESSQ
MSRRSYAFLTLLDESGASEERWQKDSETMTKEKLKRASDGVRDSHTDERVISRDRCVRSTMRPPRATPPVRYGSSNSLSIQNRTLPLAKGLRETESVKIISLHVDEKAFKAKRVCANSASAEGEKSRPDKARKLLIYRGIRASSSLS